MVLGARTSCSEAVIDPEENREPLKFVSKAVSQSVLCFGKVNTDNGLEGWSMRERREGEK